MKPFSTLSFLLAFALVFHSCNITSSSEPEDVGKKAFSAIKKLSTDNQLRYMENFITIEELRKIGSSENGHESSPGHNRLTSITKEEWTTDINEKYIEAKKKGASYGINWTEIEYLDYIYKVDELEGLKVMSGELYFKYSETSYKMRVSAIWTGREYKIVVIDRLKRQ